MFLKGGAWLRISLFLSNYIMTKEIGVKFTINDQELPINGDIKTSYDIDGNLIIEFLVGKSKLDKVKMVFNKKDYLDIEDEKTGNI